MLARLGTQKEGSEVGKEREAVAKAEETERRETLKAAGDRKDHVRDDAGSWRGQEDWVDEGRYACAFVMM